MYELRMGQRYEKNWTHTNTRVVVQMDVQPSHEFQIAKSHEIEMILIVSVVNNIYIIISVRDWG